MFSFIFFLALLLLVVLGVAWVVMHLLGFRMVRHPERLRTQRDVQPAEGYSPPSSPSFLSEATRRTILLSALSEPPFVNQLLPEQRDVLRQALISLDQPHVSSAGPAGASPVTPSLPSVPREGDRPARASRQAMVETVRASWDPAVMMLYLGALLVVIAGLIFASYSWGTWGGWQKLGMLIAATGAFLIAGFGLQRFERIRPAARTFITIGGLLVPANALAAYTIFRDADPLLILLVGATVTALVHGVLSMQPQSYVFRYTSVAATLLAIMSLPGAMGLRAAWGCALALACIAVPPDPWGRLERFARAWMFTGAVAVLPLAGIGLISNQGEKHWVIPVLLLSLGMALSRIASRAPNVQVGLKVIADIVLVVANVTVAWILTGDQWAFATVLLSIALIFVRYSRAYSLLAPELETLAAFPLAGFLGETTRAVSTPDWGTTVFLASLTLGMLLVAWRWLKTAPLTQGIAAFTLPAALMPWLDPMWDRAVFYSVVTITLILWRWRHRILGDLPYALASITAIAAVFAMTNASDVESDLTWAAILTLTAIIGTAVANLLRASVLSNWVRNLIRLETVPLFLLAFVIDIFEEPHTVAISLVAIAAMSWNVWVGRHACWTLPGVLFMALMFEAFAIPPAATDYDAWWLFILLTVLLGALAWQIDRRTAARQRPAGLYVWVPLVLASIWLLREADVYDLDFPIGVPLGLITLAIVHLMAMRSTRIWLFALPAVLYTINANTLLLQPAVQDPDHLFIAVGLIAATVGLLLGATRMRSRFGFALLALAVLHLNAAYDQPAVPGVLIGLVVAWLLLSLGLARTRMEPDGWHLGEAAIQASFMHVVALFGPSFGSAEEVFTRSGLVLGLMSIAGTIAVYGTMVRSRWHLFLASGFAMAALMIQINAGQPGNVHVYTVPLAVYLLGVGFLLRANPRTANVLLAAGSGVLVVPAMLEALTTGSLTWLWIALAEALALFLLGMMLQLRIPTAAAVIAVSVIALRMLVMAINAYASWISMLAIGVVLLLLGTLWLIYRDAIQERLHGIFSRWLAFH